MSVKYYLEKHKYLLMLFQLFIICYFVELGGGKQFC